MSSMGVHHSGTILYALLTPGQCADKDPDVLHTLLCFAAGGAVLCDRGYSEGGYAPGLRLKVSCLSQVLRFHVNKPLLRSA